MSRRTSRKKKLKLTKKDWIWIAVFIALLLIVFADSIKAALTPVSPDQNTNLSDSTPKVESEGLSGDVKAIFKDIPNNNDFTFVGDEIWFAQHVPEATFLHRYKIKGDALVPIKKMIRTDFGHWNSVDYNSANDCLLFSDAANDTVTEGNFFSVIINPRAIDTEATLATHSIRYPVDVGYKVQAVWGDSNLGENNIVYLLSDDCQTITKVMLKQNEEGQFYANPATGFGEYIVLETAKQSEKMGVGGAHYWMDHLYVGNGEKQGWKQISMSDYTVQSVDKTFYRDDGTKIIGSTQGIYVDDDYLWVYYNVKYSEQVRENEGYLVQYYR